MILSENSFLSQSDSQRSPIAQSLIADTPTYQKAKGDIHKQLIEVLDLGQMNDHNLDTVKREVRTIVSRLVSDQVIPLNGYERTRLVDDLMDEVFGFGPLEPLLNDPEISDILVNKFDEIFIEKKGKLSRVGTRFRDTRHLLQIIDRIVSRVGRRVDETSPMVDARLPDGSRVNAIIPPLSLNGPSLSIRRFGVNPITLSGLLANDSITEEFVELLEAAVKAKLNIVISGGTGSGKTTLLNILSSFIPSDERIITIEDSAELILQQPHIVRLETRPPNIEGRGHVTQRDLLFNALRMRPDRIIVGEVRGAEALDMLQAMNTGHDGSLTTVHANTPRDSLSRVETMVSMTGFEMPIKAVRQQISSAINIVIQTSRLVDGKRKVVSISEIVGMESDMITMHEIFRFMQKTVNSQGQVEGYFTATGIRPHFMNKIESAGIRLSPKIFDPSHYSNGRRT